LEWLHTFEKAPQVTYLVHGEPSASALMQAAITNELKWNVEVADWMEKAQLE
jgi:metallo-beta-lactamase family protein